MERSTIFHGKIHLISMAISHDHIAQKAPWWPSPAKARCIAPAVPACQLVIPPKSEIRFFRSGLKRLPVFITRKSNKDRNINKLLMMLMSVNDVDMLVGKSNSQSNLGRLDPLFHPFPVGVIWQLVSVKAS